MRGEHNKIKCRGGSMGSYGKFDAGPSAPLTGACAVSGLPSPDKQCGGSTLQRLDVWDCEDGCPHLVAVGVDAVYLKARWPSAHAGEHHEERVAVLLATGNYARILACRAE